jgi:Ran GTPase-activating protein (RanGAP) involved in mRNA processing and transport
VALLEGGWTAEQEAILRASALVSLASLAKAFADLDRRGRPVRVLFGRPWVAGSAPAASVAFAAVLIYRLVSVCGRVLLFLLFHQLTYEVLQLSGFACGSLALAVFDVFVQCALIQTATCGGGGKLLWALPGVLSPPEPVLHGGGPTHPALAAASHFGETLVAAGIAVYAHGSLAGVLVALEGRGGRDLLALCAACCGVQLPLLLGIRYAFAYEVEEAETWEAFAPSAGTMGVYPAQMDEADFRAPSFFFFCFGGLERIELDGQKIGDTGATVIASVLAHQTTVKQLYLTDNEIGDAGLAAIAASLGGNGTVQRLGLDCNDVGDAGAAAVASALRSNTTVQQLDLIKNRISDIGAGAIASALEVNSALTEVNLRENSIGDTGASALAMALKRNSSLRRLSLDCNDIGDVGAQAIGSALAINTTIQHVDLISNKIGDTGAEAIASALERHSAIREVYLRENLIGDRGAKAIAAALKKNSTVERVCLDSNKIADEGAEAIASAMWQNIAVQQIDLTLNRIKDAGGEAIASALKHNTTVQRLSVDKNDIGGEVLRAIDGALQKNNRC